MLAFLIPHSSLEHPPTARSAAALFGGRRWPSGPCVYSPLFRSLVQVLSVVVPSSSATLVLYRWDQQRTTDHLHRVPTHTDGPWGRCNERRQSNKHLMLQRGTAGRGERQSA